MGKIYIKLKTYKSALDMYNKSLLIDKTKKYVYINKGVCHFNLKEYKDALDVYDRGL